MNKNGPVIIIEDDEDDRAMLTEIFTSLNYANEIMFFTDCDIALEHLCKTEVMPFLILSDIHMPKLSGIELRNKLHNTNELHLKCIPYLFFTTIGSKQMVMDAYGSFVQGYFVKPNKYSDLETMLGAIMNYWKICTAPNEFAN